MTTKNRKVSTSDLQTMLHYNRPKSTPLGKELNGNVTPTTQFINPVRSTSVIPVSADSANESFRTSSEEGRDTETTPLLSNKRNSENGEDEIVGDIREYMKSYFTISNYKTILNDIKIIILLIFTVTCCCIIIFHQEHEESWHHLAVESNEVTVYNLSETNSAIVLHVKGPIRKVNDTDETNGTIEISIVHEGMGASDSWKIGVNKSLLFTEKSVDMDHNFNISQIGPNDKLVFQTNSPKSIPLTWTITESHDQVIYAALVLVFVYVLIVFDLVHRAIAAMLGSLAAMAVLAISNQRPDLETVISWIDMETLMLLFGMMILVSIFSETGFFDFFALKAYTLAKGQVWPLVTLLCAFSAIVSAFLDNVTTILLLTPVTIRRKWKWTAGHIIFYLQHDRIGVSIQCYCSSDDDTCYTIWLCEVLNLDPKNILIAEVLFSNIGGTATAIGDPPNVIIVNNKDLMNGGIDFAVLTGHMSIGIVFVTFVCYGMLRLYYRKMESLQNKDPPEVAEMKHEIHTWKRAAARVSVASREESIMRALFMQKAAQRENALIRQMFKKKKLEKKDFEQNLIELGRKYCITDQWLLIKSSCVLLAVILLFFMYSFITEMYVNLGWIAIMGAIVLLVLADMNDLENVLHRVEWGTLIFFAALFVLMEALQELKLINWIGDRVIDAINSVEEGQRLAVAILLILWVSAIASSFIDNIPYTTAMIPVLVLLSEGSNLPLLPLVFSLAFGACLGGNGTLIGASANVVCAGIAEQHGYGFTFTEFFKVGFPMMLVSTLVATVYLIICHVAIEWNT